MLSEWDGGAEPDGPPDRTSRGRGPLRRGRRVPRPLRDRRARGAAAVRRRRGRPLRLRPRAHGRADARRAEPGPGRPARHGADDHRRARRLRPPAPRGDRDRQRLRRDDGGDRGGLRARRADDRRDHASGCASPVPPLEPQLQPGRGRLGVEHDPRASSRRTSRGSSSTSTPATPSRSCPRSASAPRSRSRPSPSTAGCAWSTRRPTCTSSTSTTSRSPAPRPSRWSR